MIELPAVLTAAQLTSLGVLIAALTALVQYLSFIPIPDGSKARAWLIAVLAAAFVALNVPNVDLAGADLVTGILVSWSTLASAALGLNRAGTSATSTVKSSLAPGDEAPPAG